MILALLMPACGGHRGGDATPAAPVISEFSLWPEYAYLSNAGGWILVDGIFAFEDSDADLLYLTLTIFDSSGDSLGSGSILIEDVQGMASGYIYFEFQADTTIAGTYTFSVHVTDARGQNSNELTAPFRVIPNPWVPKSPMLASRWATSIVVADGLIYVLGGFTMHYPYDPSSVVQIYNPANDTWRTAASTPLAGTVAAGAACGRVYVFGTTTTYVYDPGLDTWTPTTSIPLPRSPGVATVNDFVYVMGGIDENNTSTTSVEIYDAASDTWSFGAPLVSSLVNLRSTSTGGKIYLTEGTWIYTAATDIWSPGFGMPDPRPNMGWVASGTAIYAIGGFEHGSLVEAYEPSTGTWSQKQSPPMPLPEANAVELNGKIYVFEQSIGPDSEHNYVFEYTPANDPK